MSSKMRTRKSSLTGAIWRLLGWNSQEMPQNVEIKAKVVDPEKLEKLVFSLTESHGSLLKQEDVFFKVPSGRLKLRRHNEHPNGELIYYQRPNVTGAKSCQYTRTEISDANSLQETLSQALGILGLVKKQRRVCIYGQTRIHLDDVEELGPFMELEVMLEEGQTVESGEQIADDLVRKLEIPEADLIPVAYIDMLLDPSCREKYGHRCTKVGSADETIPYS